MLSIYGPKASRAFRTYWLADEIGLEYEQIDIDIFTGQQKSADYLKVNPMGQVPALVDGELSMGESLAMNLYLAKKYGGQVAAQTLEEEAHILQWTLWVATGVETLLPPIIHNRIIMPKAMRDEAAVAAAVSALSVPLARLDAHLSEQPYLVGERFTVADLNVSAVLSMLWIAEIDTAPFGVHLSDWLERCLTRPKCDYEMQRTQVTPEMLEKLAALRQEQETVQPVKGG